MLDTHQKSSFNYVDQTGARNQVQVQNLDVLVSHAYLLLQHKHNDLGFQLFQKILQTDSHNLDALIVLGKKYFSEAKYENARVYLTAALKQITFDSASFEILAQIGICYHEMGEFEKSKQYLVKSLEKVDEVHVLLFDVYKNLGNIYLKEKDIDASEEFYNKALAIIPNSEIILTNLGSLKIQTNDIGAAIYCYREAVNVAPQYSKAWIGLAISHFYLGDYELAKANLEAALDVKPDDTIAIQLYCDWSEKLNNLEQALERLCTAVYLNDFNKELSLKLVTLFIKNKKMDLALLELEKMMCWAPEDIEVFNLYIQIKESK